MTYTPHVWSRHDKLDSKALNNLEDAVGNFSVAQLTADDATIAPIISGGSQTQAAVNTQIDAHLKSTTGWITPATVSHADLQAALTSTVGTSNRVRAAGAYTTDQTLIIGSSCDLSGLTITYTGAGVAVQVGSSALGQLARLRVSLPMVVCGTKQQGVAVWPAGTVGVKVVNTFRSRFDVPLVQDFETGLLLYGDGTYGLNGTSYCTFEVTSLANNLRNQMHDYNTNGWVTQCTFNGGSWSHQDGVYPVAGMRHIIQTNSGSNHTWNACSLEDTRAEYLIECGGTDNAWLSCRWEFGNGAPPMWWRNGSNRNILLGGYELSTIVHTVETGGQKPQILGGNMVEMPFSDPSGLTLYSSGGATNVLTIMTTNWFTAGYTKTANYAWAINSSGAVLKAPTDANPRWSVNYTTRSMTLGSGVNASATQIAWGTGSPEATITANIGSTFYNYGAGTTGFGKYQKGTGAGNTGWQAIGFQPFTTAARPAASLAGIGGTYYDTTLHKPGWSDGTAWRDATGTAM